VLAVLVLGASMGMLAPPVAAAERRCNGRAEYCDLRLDQYAFPTTHNSSASRQDGVLFPNQQYGMRRQLRDGIRGFQIDAFLGTRRRRAGIDAVFTDLNGIAKSRAVDAIGPAAVATATQIRRRLGAPPRNAHYDVYLCHNFCELGAVKMLDESKHLATFLDRHPGAVVFWVVQDELPAERLLPILRDSGLDRYLTTVDPARPLPTLGELVDSGRRLVIGLEHGDLGPELPNVFRSGLVQEVPYRYERVRALRPPESCRPLRGPPEAPLFQLNHWITPASRRASREVNQFEFLDRRARECARIRDRVPTLVAVDFYESGDLFRVARALNKER
jgi:hypothetical protein